MVTTPPVFERLTYAFAVGPQRLIPRDFEVANPAAGILRVRFSKNGGEALVEVEGETHEQSGEDAAEACVLGLLDLLSLRSGKYEAPSVAQTWRGLPGAAVRLFVGLSVAGAGVATVAIISHPVEDDALFLKRAPNRLKAAAESTKVQTLQTALRDASIEGGILGYVRLFDGIVETSEPNQAKQRTHATADEWILALSPNTPMSRHPKRKKPPEETVFARVRNEIAHGHEREVTIEEVARSAKQTLPRLQAIVAQGIRRELGF